MSIVNLKEKKKEEDKLNFKLTIRVFGFSTDCRQSHSYLVGNMFSDISSPIGQLMVDIRKVTLQQIRPMIEFDRSNHMDKRSMMFQEAIFIMDRLPNHFQRPQSELRKYKLGFIKKDKSSHMIVEQEDETKAIDEFFGAVEFFNYDLCIFPLSQLSLDR